MNHPILNKSLTALILILFLLSGCDQQDPSAETRQERTAPSFWEVSRDGSFNLVYKDIRINNAYPAINGVSIKPLKIQVTEITGGHEIRYFLEESREIILTLKNEPEPSLSTSLSGFEVLPDWIHPLSSGEITGANRFYKQGMGFGGPSGIFEFPEARNKIERAVLKEEVWSYESYLFSGLLDTVGHTLSWAAFDHKDYLHRTTFYNRQHRFGLIDRHLDSEKLFVESGFATEGIPGGEGTLNLPAIHFRFGNRPFEVFHNLAVEVAESNEVILDKNLRYYYCSWYEFQKDFSYGILEEFLENMEKMDTDPRIQAVQIDDGYAWYGDWLTPRGTFPEGIEAAIRKIEEHGYTPGIWVAPFMVSSNSFIFREHKEWLLRDAEGEIILEWDNENEDVYILDSSHPEAFEYIRKVFRTFREMGVRLYKTDFMDWGLQDNQKVSRHSPGKTSVQYFREVITMIREEMGDDSFWLGCISPFQPMIGFVDGMRVSNDVHWNWSDEGVGNMFREMYVGQFFNNVLWQNDPDVLYLRSGDKMGLSEVEKYSIALYNGIMGGMITTSCRFPTVKEEFMTLWKFIEPGDQPHTASLPLWDSPEEVKVAVRNYPENEAMAILFVNTSGEKKTVNYPLNTLCPFEEAFVYEWLNFKSEALGSLKTLNLILDSHESRLLYLSSKNDPPGEEFGLGGN